MTLREKNEIPVIRKNNDIFTTFNQIQNMIRDRAYSIFTERAPDKGNSLSDWLKAESEVLTEIDLSLKDDEDHITIEGNAAGFLPEEIEIKAKDGVFEIGGLHAEKSSSKEKGMKMTAMKQINFYRSFNLPDSVDTNKMKVKLENGKINVEIPKTAHLDSAS